MKTTMIEKLDPFLLTWRVIGQWLMSFS
jgi:hypothetical protein